MLLHLGTAQILQEVQDSTLWQRLTPRSRLLSTLVLVFAISLTPNGQWWSWVIYGVWGAIAILMSRVDLSTLVKRVAVELVFVSAVVIGTLFRPDGEVLFQWGLIRITTEGLMILGSVTLKSFLSLLVLNVLILTTSTSALLHALVELRTPPLLVAILSSMSRYIYVLMDEFNSMQRAARSRNLMSNRKRQRLIIGNMFGSLFLRTYDRGDRVHQAMLARGYQGIPPRVESPKNRKLDILVVTLTTIVALLGQAVYLRIHAP